MTLVSFAITVTLSFFSAGDWELTVNPELFIDAPVGSLIPVSAIALPNLVILDGNHIEPDVYKYVIIEETAHLRQWGALGIYFVPAYAATLGRAFEPYDPVVEWSPGVRNDLRDMWIPTKEQASRCSMFRIKPHTFTFMPCFTSP